MQNTLESAFLKKISTFWYVMRNQIPRLENSIINSKLFERGFVSVVSINIKKNKKQFPVWEKWCDDNKQYNVKNLKIDGKYD